MSVIRSESHVGDYITCLNKIIPSTELVKIVRVEYECAFVEYGDEEIAVEWRLMLTNRDGMDRIRRFDKHFAELDSI